MTKLQLRLREELVRRDFSESGLRTYLQAVEAFRRWLGKRLDHAGPDELRRYHAYLLEERKLAKNTVVTQISALRFFYLRVRRRMRHPMGFRCSVETARRLPQSALSHQVGLSRIRPAPKRDARLRSAGTIGAGRRRRAHPRPGDTPRSPVVRIHRGK